MARATALLARGDLDGAAALAGALVRSFARDGRPAYLLAVIAGRRGDGAGAVAWARRAAAVEPDRADYLKGLAHALGAVDRAEDAAHILRAALCLAPDDGDGTLELARQLRAAGSTADALRWARLAWRTDGTRGDALLEIANIHRLGNAVGPALAANRAALLTAPERPEIEAAYGLLLKLDGKLAEGLGHYEARLRLPGRRRAELPGAPWRGEPYPGRTLVAYAELGFGDTLAMARYLAPARALGGRLIVESHRETAALLAAHPAVTQSVARGDALPDADLHVSLTSLPHLLGTTERAIPADVPYLVVPEDRRGLWSSRLGPTTGRPRVGLVWAGNPANRNDRNRSIPFDRLTPLLALDFIDWVSLQVGPRAGDLARADRPVLDLGRQLDDFADTAAVLDRLDLVITIESAVAHLAGALGRPCWLLLSWVVDWRWGLSGTRSPWYPSFRLFRQAGPGNWVGVVEAVRAALVDWRPAP